MKFNFMKKALSFTVALSVIISTFVTVDAAGINGFPWSKDFEGMSDVSYTSWLNPADTNLDCTFYGAATSVLSIKDDEDLSHGKVMHIEVDESDTAERFVMFTIPKISSGKFMFEFDAKTAGPAMTFTANETTHTGYNHVVTMSNNAIFGNVTYNLNEWKTFRCLFDVDKNQITAFVDGESKTATSAYATTQAMKFIVRAGAGGVTFDNFKLYPVSGTTATMSVLTAGTETGNFVDYEASDFTVAVADSYFATVPEITVTDLGADILSDTDDMEMDIEATYNNGNINVTLGDYLNPGSKYRISIPEGTIDMFGRVIENTSVEFYAAENNGWITSAEYKEDFNYESVPTSGNFGVNNLFFNVVGSAKIVTGDEYTDGKALSITNQTALNHGFPVRAKKGYVHIDTKMKLNDGAYVRYDTEGAGHQIPLFYGNTATDLTGDGVKDPSVSYFYQPYRLPQYHTEQYKYAMWEKRLLRTGLDTISYTIDMDTQTAYINHNGTEFSYPVLADINSNAKLEHGIRLFRFQGSAANPLIIDYFNWSHEYQPAVVEEIEVSSDTAGKVDVKSQIVIAFSESMKEDTLSNITVSDGTENAEYTGVWNAENLTYTLTFAKKLKAETNYTVTIPDTVKDYADLSVYETYGTFKTAPVPPMDVENLVATKDGANVVVSADVTNAVDGKVYLAVASYEGNVMQDMNYIAVDVTESSTNVNYTFEDLKAGSVVKAFAIKDMATITPYCTAVEAQ